jgi:hypothetical protein
MRPPKDAKSAKWKAKRRPTNVRAIDRRLLCPLRFFGANEFSSLALSQISPCAFATRLNPPLRNQPQLRLPSHPSADADVFPLRILKVLQILSKRILVELGKKLRHGRRIEPADIIDELTFAHGVLSFH